MSVPRTRSSASALVYTILLAWFTALLAGCPPKQQSSGAPATQMDRLQEVYEPLKGGRFIVLADFEDSAQADLFSTDDESSFVLQQRKDRRASGGHVLMADLEAGDSTITMANTLGTEAYRIPRDWRAFDLLLLNVEAPSPGGDLDLGLTAGIGDQETSVHASYALAPGWNLIRVDLAELAEHIPLDDVRSVTFSLPRKGGEARIALDDLILTTDRETIYGNLDGTSGELYVQRIANHWAVGSNGRFELVFSRGQITAWYDLQVDPNRLRNLVRGAAFGPTVVRAAHEGDGPLVMRPGPALGWDVDASQRLVEASDIRVVIECVWNFKDSGEESVSQKCTYAVHPDGSVLADLKCSPVELADGSLVAAAWNVSTAGDGKVELLGRSSSGPTPDALAAALHAGPSSLLICAPQSGESGRRVSISCDDVRHSCTVLAPMADRAEGEKSLTALSAIHIGGGDSTAALRALAASFMKSYEPEAALGQVLAPNADGERTEQDSGCGAYVLVPSEGVVRFRWSWLESGPFTPSFIVRDSADKDSWIYVNHVIHTPVSRDANGNVLFRLTPGDRPVLVEVLLRDAASPSLP